MTTIVQLKTRALNLSSKKLKELDNMGFMALTFTGENLQPFYGFAHKDELLKASENEYIIFKWQGERIVAKFSKLLDEGWLSKKYVHHYSVVESELPCVMENAVSMCA